ncbi:unnamed protein product [Paramecium sonneborni]|uniref:Uncharacterized protein n=1 Tax=Paramecium sonneborni TaxID=65129 RepID=A0A8S1NLX7_9CILI|nr:unnamed protein product [Paramecium sonneborni]
MFNKQIDGAIIKQQKELKKINQATQLLTRQLRANSMTHKKEVENIKTQKNFSKLPQIKKVEISVNSNNERGREQSSKYRKTPGNNVGIITQRTLEKNSQKNQDEYENNGFEPYESNRDLTDKLQLQNPNENNFQNNNNNQSNKSQQQQNKLVQIAQLPSLQKKYQKEIQLVLTKPKQNRNENTSSNTSQSPIQLQSRSVGARDTLPPKIQQKSLKFDFKKLSSQKIEKQKSKVQFNQKNNGRQENIPFQIKIIDANTQNEKKEETESNIAKTNTKVPVEIVEDVVQDFSNESGIFQNQVETEQNKNEQEKISLQGTAFFKIPEEDEHKETFEKLDESNQFKQESIKNSQDKQDDNNFIKMIQEQVKSNDERLLKQQQTEQSINLLESVNQNNLIKVIETIEAKTVNDNIVNPLEETDDQKKDQQANSLFITLEQSQQKDSQEPYQNEGFEQDS